MRTVFLIFLSLLTVINSSKSSTILKKISSSLSELESSNISELTTPESSLGKRKDRSNSLLEDSLISSETPLIELDDSVFEESEKPIIKPADLLKLIAKIIQTKQSGQLHTLTLDESTLMSLKDTHRHQHIQGHTFMHLAAFHNNEEAIRWLAEKGCDTNVYMGKGCTPLQIASFKGNLAAVRTLLSIPKTNPHASSAHGRTAFMSAVQKGHLEIVNEFLNAPGIDLGKLLNACDSDGRSVLELAFTGNCESTDNGTLVIPADLNLLFAKANDLIINRLLDFSAFIRPDSEFLVRLFAVDREKFKILARKFPFSVLRAVKLVDVDLINWAIGEEDFDTLRAIHTVIPPTYIDSFGLLPIHFAASIGAKDVLQFYLTEYSIPIDVRSLSGLTCEDYARINGHADLEFFIHLHQLMLTE